MSENAIISDIRNLANKHGYATTINAALENYRVEAYRAGRIAQAKEDAVTVTSVKTVFMAGYPDTTATLNRAADSILAAADRLRAEDDALLELIEAPRASGKEGE